MQEVLDAALIRRWCSAARDALGRARAEIDALNVYPVPDGDTGTNLYLTMEAAAQAADDAPDDLREVMRAVATGALVGARGNSGVILSQLLRGALERLAEVAPEQPTALDLAHALARADERGRAAVARPVEGTILSVARGAAEAAFAVAGPTTPLFRVARAAARGARDALERTPEQLAVLARAGVVDAGGRGLVVVLDAFDTALTGWRPMAEGPGRHVPHPSAGVAPDDAAPAAPAYEVMYLLDATDEDADALRVGLDALGTSVLVVGGDGLWNVHAHVDDVGAALEAGIRAGRPHRVRVSRFADAVATSRSAGRAVRRAVIALSDGEGLADVLRQGGATVVRTVPGQRCSTAELLAALAGTGAGEVVVLPDDREAVPVAEAAAAQAREDGTRVAVIPTRATVQVIAALAVHEPGRPFDEDVIAMTTAAGATRHGAVAVAEQEGVTSGGRCRPGDALGVVDDDIVVVGADLGSVCTDVVERMLAAGGELVTLVTGEDGGAALADTVVRHLRVIRPDVDVTVHRGGQARFPLLVGVE